MVWIKETEIREVSKIKPSSSPFRRLQRPGDGAGPQQRCAQLEAPRGAPGSVRAAPGRSAAWLRLGESLALQSD